MQKGVGAIPVRYAPHTGLRRDVVAGKWLAGQWPAYRKDRKVGVLYSPDKPSNNVDSREMEDLAGLGET